MARSTQQIQTQITASYVAAMAAINIAIDPTKWSRRNLQQLAIFIFSGGTAIFEQLYDAFVVLIQSLIAAASPQTGTWFQAQMLKFQFDATTPQVLQFDTTNFAPFYPVVDATKQVIKYCSVVAGAFGTTTIKVAAQVAGLPSDLDTAFTGALAAAQSYANLLSVPGITINVQSGNSDKIYLAATIYYQGLFSAVISSTVIAAIQAYLAGIPFNGVVVLSDIERAVKAVAGVNDIVFTNVQARADGTAYGSGTNLVIGIDGLVPSGNTIQRRWATIAGYVISETTATHTLSDSLTFVAE